MTKLISHETTEMLPGGSTLTTLHLTPKGRAALSVGDVADERSCDCGATPDPSESPTTGNYVENGVAKYLCLRCWQRENGSDGGGRAVMTAYNPTEVERLIVEAREHIANALWEPLAEIACYNVGPATHAVVKWLSSRRGLLRMADQLSAAKAEIDRLTALASVSPDDIRDIANENARVEAENQRLRDAFDLMIKQLDDGGTVRSAFCSWCNQRWPQLDGETFEVTRKYANDHLQTCPAHPLRSELTAAQTEIASAKAVLYRTGVPPGLSLTEGTDWLARCRPIWDDVAPLKRDLAAAQATIERLTETARAAGENWMSACRQRDEARAALREACAMLRGCRSGEDQPLIMTSKIDSLLAVADSASAQPCPGKDLP